MKIDIATSYKTGGFIKHTIILHYEIIKVVKQINWGNQYLKEDTNLTPIKVQSNTYKINKTKNIKKKHHMQVVVINSLMRIAVKTRHDRLKTTNKRRTPRTSRKHK